MPSQRRTIQELDFLSSLLDRYVTKVSNQGSDLLTEFLNRRSQDANASPPPRPTYQSYLDVVGSNTFDRDKADFFQSRGFDLDAPKKASQRAQKLKRKIAVRELKLLRKEVTPSVGRGVERDRILNILLGGGHGRRSGWSNIRNYTDLDAWESSALFGEDPENYLYDRGGEYGINPTPAQRQEAKAHWESIQRKVKAQRQVEEIRRAAPLYKKLTAPMSRRDLFRGIRTLGARAAAEAPLVKNLTLAAEAKADPLFFKLVKALISRKFR